MSNRVQGESGGQGQASEAPGKEPGDPNQAKGAAEPFEFLSREQMRALKMLTDGNPISEVAEAIGVNRGTVYRWLKADKYFRATFNAWLSEQRESYRIEMFKSAKVAVARIATMVDYDHNLAWKMAKEMGLVVRPTPLMTDPDQVEREIAIEEQEMEAVLQQRQAARPSATENAVPAQAATSSAEKAPGIEANLAAISDEEKRRREKVSRDNLMNKVATSIG